MILRGIGLICGTSLDGIDAACVEIDHDGDRFELRTVAAATSAFDPALRDRLLKAMPPAEPSPREVCDLDLLAGEAFADAAEAVRSGPLDFVASHGITLFHDGSAHLTAQIANPYVLRDRLGATVVHDFRRADCALGGEGAPLVPYLDTLLFGDDAVVALNIGGIANVSIVTRGHAADMTLGWDTGPGNILIDAFVRLKTGGAHAYDPDGAYAAEGTVDETRLNRMLGDPYFSRVPPKSTGRERFGARFLAAYDLFSLSLEDGCATLTELSAQTIAREVERCAPADSRVIVSGGGADNPVLLDRLRRELHGLDVVRSDEFGIDASFKEAIAFAVLGYETLRGRPSSLPRVTGASGAAILGSVVPHGLPELMAKIVG
jgi:anhydro-N-acetylmuramic acid kinase